MIVGFGSGKLGVSSVDLPFSFTGYIRCPGFGVRSRRDEVHATSLLI